MRLIDLNGSGGNQDRSLSASAIGASAVVFLRKEVFTPNQCDTWNEGFGFLASNNFRGGAPNNSFFLYDLNRSAYNPNTTVCNRLLGATPGDALASNLITTFNGVANVFSFTESSTSDFDLTGASCTQFGTPPVQNFNAGTRTLTVTVAPYRAVVCTFQNQFAVPTAAPANVSGRVVNSAGRGISGINMILTNLETGESRIARTNTFGYFMIDGVDTGVFYSLTASAKRYTFAEPTRFFTLNEDTFDLNFYASN